MCLTWKTCCCCVSLEVGAQLIGVLAIVGNISAIGYVLYEWLLTPASADPSHGSLVSHCVILVLAALELIFAVLMTRGAFHKRPSLMWPWIVTAWVSGVALLVLKISLMVYRLGSEHAVAAGDVANIAVYTANSVLLIYFSCVVNSRRKQMVSEYYASPVRFANRADSYERRLYVPVTTYDYKP